MADLKVEKIKSINETIEEVVTDNDFLIVILEAKINSTYWTGIGPKPNPSDYLD